MVTGKAWNSWIPQSKPGTKEDDQLQNKDPWTCEIPESEEEKNNDETKPTANENKVETPRVQRQGYDSKQVATQVGLSKTKPQRDRTKTNQDKDAVRQEDVGAVPDSEFMQALKSLGLHNTNNSVNNIMEDINDIKDDLGKLESWVQSLVDDLNERVKTGFAAHQDMIDEVEDKVENITKTTNN